MGEVAKVESTINGYNVTKQETLTINNWLHLCRAHGPDVGGMQLHDVQTCYELLVICCDPLLCKVPVSLILGVTKIGKML